MLAETFCLVREPIPVDPDTGTTLVCWGWKDRTACCAGTADLCPAPPLVNHCVGNVYNSLPSVAIPTTRSFFKDPGGCRLDSC